MIPLHMLADEVTVESYTGQGAYGATFAPAQTVRCNVDAARRLVRGPEGSEVVSEVTLHVAPSVAPEVFAPGSRVTFGGRASTVITTKPHTAWGRTIYYEVTVA